MAAVSQQIAAGNLTVFQELGPLFARMVATFDGPGPCDPARRAALVAWVQALDGDAVATARLRTVFGQYCDALLDAERMLRADQILLANGLAGLTEQIRLQPNIQGALDAPIETSLGAWLERTVARLPEPVRAGARPVLRLVVIEIEAAWRHVATELLMQLATPSGDSDLGKDVPAPPGGPLFPEDLGAIRGPELVALLRGIRPDRRDGHRQWREGLGEAPAAHELHPESLPLTPAGRRAAVPAVHRRPVGGDAGRTGSAGGDL